MSKVSLSNGIPEKSYLQSPTGSAKSESHLLGVIYILGSVALSLQFLHGATSNLVLVVILFALVIAKLPYNRTKLQGHDWIYLLYFSFALLSASWSIAALETVEQTLPMIIPWVAGFLLCDLSEQWVCKMIVRIAVVGSILSLFIIVVSPRLAFQPVSSSGAPELRGVFAHQLFLGSYLVIALGLIAIAYVNGDAPKIFGSSRYLGIAVIVLLVGVLFLSRTRLYVAAGILAFSLTWLLARAGSRRWLAGIVLAIVGVTISLSLGRIIAFLEAQNFDLTLTGRVNIWEKVLTATEGGTDLLGFGYGTFQLPAFDYLFGWYRPAHAHNSFLQIYFEIGAIGLGLLLLLVLLQLVAAWRYSVRSNKYSYAVFMVLFSIFSSLTGAGIYASFLTTPFCIMLLFLAIESRKQIAPNRLPQDV